MGWNYRVIRSEDDTGPNYAIHECYYTTKGSTVPDGWSSEPEPLAAETRDGLLWVLSVMAEAIGRPVLEVRDRILVEVEPKKELSDDIKAALEMGKLVGTGDYDFDNPPLPPTPDTGE